MRKCATKLAYDKNGKIFCKPAEKTFCKKRYNLVKRIKLWICSFLVFAKIRHDINGRQDLSP